MAPITGNHHGDGLRFWQNLVAGSVACTVEHATMFPLDTAKTRMPGTGPGNPVKPVRIGQALCSILKSEGPAALYRGSMGSLGAVWPTQAVVVSFYEICKEVLLPDDDPDPYFEWYWVSGLCASLVSGTVLASIDMYVRKGGFRSFPSYMALVVDRAPYTAAHMTAYEVAKSYLTRNLPPGSATGSYELWPVHATAGAAAGAAVPAAMAWTRLVFDTVEACRGKRFEFEYHVRNVVENDGYKVFVRGWMPRILCHMPAGAIFWSAYEASKVFFSRKNENATQGQGQGQDREERRRVRAY